MDASSDRLDVRARAHPAEEAHHALSDDAKNKAEELKGRGKEAAGSLTDDQDLKNEGKGDQAVAQGKQKIADAADAVKGKVDDIKDKLSGN